MLQNDSNDMRFPILQVMRSFVDILYKTNITVRESVELDKDLTNMQEKLSKLKVEENLWENDILNHIQNSYHHNVFRPKMQGLL